MALVSCPNHDNISTWQLTTWHETYRLYPLVRATGKILQQWRHLYSNLLNGHAGALEAVRLVVTACAVLWWWVTALLTVWGVDGRWRAELVQLSIAATWHRPWPRPLSCTQVSWSPGHTALQRNLRQCSTALYSVLLCIRHYHDYQWSIHIYDDHPLNWHLLLSNP